MNLNTASQGVLALVLCTNVIGAQPVTRATETALADCLQDDSWYFSPGWQAAEAEADRDEAEGRVETFDDFEGFIQSLG